MKLQRTCTVATLLLAALALTGCATPDNYFEARMYDAGDMIDFKYGCDFMSGQVGAKVEATNYIGVGLGYGQANGVTENWGRRGMSGDNDFLYIFVYGYDGLDANDLVPGPETEFSILGINCCQERRPPWVSRFRFGGEVLFIGLTAGIYVNTGEIADFLVGWTTIDIADDDHMAWGTAW
jgi:hypothetical protein